MTNVNELIKSVEENQLGGSIYSQQDVIRILKMVEVTAKYRMDIDRIMDELQLLIDMAESLEVDDDSAKFSILDSNRLVVSSCEVHNVDLIDAIVLMMKNFRNGSYSIKNTEHE